MSGIYKGIIAVAILAVLLYFELPQQLFEIVRQFASHIGSVIGYGI